MAKRIITVSREFAAGAVVTKDVPDNCVVGGVQAKNKIN